MKKYSKMQKPNIEDELLERVESIITSEYEEGFMKYLSGIVSEEKSVQEYLCLSLCVKHDNSTFLAIAKNIGANLNQKETYTGDCILHLSVREGKTDVVKALIELGCDINARNEEGNTPLSYCSIVGDIVIAKLLIERKANLHELNDLGMSPLQLSIYNGNFFVSLYYLTLNETHQYLQDQIDHLISVLKTCSIAGTYELFKLILEYQSNISIDFETTYLMHYACGSGSVSIYNYIYNLSPQSANVKTEDMNETPLHWAVASNNLEVTKLLTIAYLQNGWDIDQKNLNGETALYLASIKGFHEVAKYLMNKGADVNVLSKEHESILHWVVPFNDLKGIKFVVNTLNTNINLQNNLGHTALSIACINGYSEIANYLLRKGCDPNHLNKKKQTPLHLVCKLGNFELANILINNGANLKVIDYDKFYPLHHAIINDHVSIIQLFEDITIFRFNDKSYFPINMSNTDLAIMNESWGILKEFGQKYLDLVNQVSINIVFCIQEGNMPLHTACIVGNLNIFLYFISKGADLQARNKNGKTPLELAKFYNHSVIMNYINKNFTTALQLRSIWDQ